MEISIWTCVEPIIGFAAFVALGALLRGTKILKPDDAHVLNKVITNVALPAFVFSAIYGSEFTTDALKAVGVGWVAVSSHVGPRFPAMSCFQAFETHDGNGFALCCMGEYGDISAILLPPPSSEPTT